ncbi:AbrB family transcriptional regulator [Variovorax sp. WS11]|uniref:AbrB/MazE/SpoVT family DNA-binding domain-containing protein n=1 Tax=Variovorax sp. WS11 TaxID=1105204 RepID=UPI000D0CD945|nr:AbrB/MazE/SpoVT family DNA-binding domain-containing protein [Variovorax sp. WS11]NDZ14710.1 AbrB/MazE/SpoVT family DNA-binding domain-containing protein [Variovorax sp. WS11]PSL81910.1 AbrB family transcriptional regulator [Variovorax sp. WS11]
MQTTLGSKGLMTLPSAARARLGLKAGDRLLVTVVDDNTIVLKRQPSTSIKDLRGLLARPKRALSVEDMDTSIAEHMREKHRSGTRK